MGIIVDRIKKIFDRLKKTKDIEKFMSEIIISYGWDWQNYIARNEIEKQMKLLRKEGFKWKLTKKS